MSNVRNTATISSSPPSDTQRFPTFTIKPIEGRESIQRNWSTLPSRSAAFSGRKLSLNERFGIIQRGYRLEIDENYKPTVEKKEVHLIPLSEIVHKQLNGQELIDRLIKQSDTKMLNKEKEVNDGKQCSTTVLPPPIQTDSPEIGDC